MMNKHCYNKRILIILLVLALALFVVAVGVVMLISQYRWSSELNEAIDKDNIDKVEELLNDTNKNCNFPGKCYSYFGNEKPLTAACLKNSQFVKLLVQHGAKARKSDYFVVTMYEDIDAFEKVQLLLSTGTKPIVKTGDGRDLLSTIAGNDINYGERFYDISTREWKEKILRLYKLVYYNAEPFDKNEELKLSLKVAKQAKNDILEEFLEEELKKQ